MSDCEHLHFAATVEVNRLTGSEKEVVEAYSADIRINCADCGKDFRFAGCEVGWSPAEPMISTTGLELRVPIVPEDGLPPPPFGYVRDRDVKGAGTKDSPYKPV